jgi:hypothetical protein
MNLSITGYCSQDGVTHGVCTDGLKLIPDLSPGHHIYMLRDIYVCQLFIQDNCLLTTRRIIKKIPDPITGPKGVRTLLVVRGITGCALYTDLYTRGLDVFHDSGFLDYGACIGRFSIYPSQMQQS